MRNIGVLSLQGCVTPHLRMIERLGHRATTVRTEEELWAVERLILPGGESTTMLRLLDRFYLTEALKQFCQERPSWGVCAGAILLSSEVAHPSQYCLQIADVLAYRNFYGSQRESFAVSLECALLDSPIEVDFIRAPRLVPRSSSVEVLASWGEDAVLMRQGFTLLSSFHVELESDSRLHSYFLSL